MELKPQMNNAMITTLLTEMAALQAVLSSQTTHVLVQVPQYVCLSVETILSCLLKHVKMAILFPGMDVQEHVLLSLVILVHQFSLLSVLLYVETDILTASNVMIQIQQIMTVAIQTVKLRLDGYVQHQTL